MLRFVTGLIVGLFLGAAVPVLAYYTSYTKVSELTAGDLERIMENAIEDALGSCSIRLSGDRGRFSC